MFHGHLNVKLVSRIFDSVCISRIVFKSKFLGWDILYRMLWKAVKFCYMYKAHS